MHLKQFFTFGAKKSKKEVPVAKPEKVIAKPEKVITKEESLYDRIQHLTTEWKISEETEFRVVFTRHLDGKFYKESGSTYYDTEDGKVVESFFSGTEFCTITVGRSALKSPLKNYKFKTPQPPKQNVEDNIKREKSILLGEKSKETKLKPSYDFLEDDYPKKNKQNDDYSIDRTSIRR